ncbi:hypothetical protein BH10PSE17_BH10PSE17_26870 [soil metagenome]
MDRIESLLIQSVAVGTLVFASFAGYHAADLAYTASLPVVQLERVVVTAPATSTIAGDL